MDIGNRLLDSTYQPNLPENKQKDFNFSRVIKCPVTFTDDPIEYATSFIEYKLKPIQKIILEDLFSEDENGMPKHKEAVFVAGMRSGKSLLGGIIGSFLLHKLLAMDSPGKELGQAPGQRFSGEYIATSEMQSKQTAYAAFESILMNTSWWTKYIAYLQEREVDGKEGKESLFLKHQRRIFFPEKNVEVLSLHSNSQSLAGLTAFFVCFDEMSRFDVSEGVVQQRSEKRTAQAVYYTAARAAKTLKHFSKILTITSPMYETDFGMQLLCMSEILKGGGDKNVIEALRSRYDRRVKALLGYHYSTFEANPKTDEDPFGFSEDDFEAEKLTNYSTYLRDYRAIPPSAISPFFELPERIEECVNKNKKKMVLFTNNIDTITVGSETRNYIAKSIQILQSDRMQKYFICCDQGAVKDSFTVAMGHAEEAVVQVPDARGGFNETIRHKIIIDFVEAWVPSKEDRITVSFQNVEDIISVLNSNFYIDRVVFDQWHSTESIERLFSKGVITKKLSATLEMYETMKILIYNGMIDLPPSDKLLTELRQLNIIKSNKIEHPKEGSKDLADAICRVVWCVYMDSIRDAVHGKIMLPGGGKFPTIRSVASAFEVMKQDLYNDTAQPHYGIFPSGGGGVFGKSMIVEPNVAPNIGDTKYK